MYIETDWEVEYDLPGSDDAIVTLINLGSNSQSIFAYKDCVACLVRLVSKILQLNIR